ncbi:hypothetical protein KVC_0016 [Ketogulonicigenium vulgare]|uniref:Uncharacterized protein n=1 Tax=Ketogulonicigenium vulgare (strain WSH-001) TaxID=759362 RepID=F9Y719_KETVW|nr:hypothetical protein KVU_2370 [Ketogulonicigenium vulgare WSH-001]ALJ79832.1 hypothetical protein KVH_00670 [Ketogulonicigenium vulgare]ANW34820.1 hypothetical protein KvSKV_00680 [Ketogulonicigenium vulgare]AOZ53043.1 hypothetical protein KVC_0016 [Ketogulonicigenium vulgare]
MPVIDARFAPDVSAALAEIGRSWAHLPLVFGPSQDLRARRFCASNACHGYEAGSLLQARQHALP